jgi:membrane protease YdiL (CAAX protease family)
METRRLLTEFILVFLLPPLGIVSGLLPNSAIMPFLWAVFLYSVLILRRDGVTLFARRLERRDLRTLLPRFLIVTACIGLFTGLFYPEFFFGLVREKPLLWASVVLLYPFLSVVPQEITFRRFFYHRYGTLFGRGSAVASAALFSYIHIVFGNLIAVAFTFIGGLLFAATYEKRRSVLLVSIEHALYGIAIYTFGLGVFFYHNGSY